MLNVFDLNVIKKGVGNSGGCGHPWPIFQFIVDKTRRQTQVILQRRFVFELNTWRSCT